LGILQKLLEGSDDFLVRKLMRKDSPERSIKNYITSFTFYLRDKKNELRIVKMKVKRRDDEYFGKCLGARLRNDYSHAILYASECLEMRKLYKIVFQCELALEQMIIRLETLEIFSEISYIMIFPVTSVMKRVKDEIIDFMPTISYDMEIVMGKLNDVVSNMTIDQITDINIEFSSEGSFDIFNEAKIYAEKEVESKFPVIPKDATKILELE
jgi:division protein CdvB (Snf7/Vps24/ESCRT-III family)